LLMQGRAATSVSGSASTVDQRVPVDQRQQVDWRVECCGVHNTGAGTRVAKITNLLHNIGQIDLWEVLDSGPPFFLLPDLSNPWSDRTVHQGLSQYRVLLEQVLA
jgi:hypothetical protein